MGDINILRTSQYDTYVAFYTAFVNFKKRSLNIVKTELQYGVT
jgi:hypothetical protein